MCVVLSPKAHLSETRSPSNATLADVKTSSPLCAGSKTDIMPLTKKAPAVALSNLWLHSVSHDSLRGYVVRKALICMVKQRSPMRRTHFALCAQLDFISMVWKLLCKYCGWYAPLEWMPHRITWARRRSSELLGIPQNDRDISFSIHVILQTSIMLPAMQW